MTLTLEGKRQITEKLIENRNINVELKLFQARFQFKTDILWTDLHVNARSGPGADLAPWLKYAVWTRL